jgi:hypothetical protein
MHAEYPSRQRANLLEGVLDDLTRHVEIEGVPHHVAFAQLALDWLGIGDNEQNYRTDGAGDRGLDCYRFGNDELELYQFKSQDFITNRTVLDTPVGSNCLSDISRIAGLLSSAGEPHREANRHIKRFLKQLQSAVRTFQQAEDVVDDVATSRQQRTFTITLTLAVRECPDRC